MKNGLPVVVLVGKPNVGKSSIFNLVAGHRKALVHDRAGTTRDVNEEKIYAEPKSFYLRDTGGYTYDGEFSGSVRKKIKEALEDAELVLLVVDVNDVGAMDEEIARFLRSVHDNVVVLANKVDSKEKEILLGDVFSLGFDRVITLSTKSRYGFNDFMNFIQENIPEPENIDTVDTPEIAVAVVGKPNVGKSMLVNAMLGWERAIVSDVAGTTVDSIDDVFSYRGIKFLITDTAGLRKKSRVKDDLEHLSNVRAVRAIERADVVVLLLDASAGSLTEQEKKIANLIIRRGKACVIALNKWDLVRTGRHFKDINLFNKAIKSVRRNLPLFDFVPVVWVSALRKEGISKLLDQVVFVYGEYKKRIKTADLNEWLRVNVREYENQPKGKVKIYYATQVESSPPTFVFFVNNPSLVSESYKRFLENRIRDGFGFIGSPINLLFRGRGRKVGEGRR